MGCDLKTGRSEAERGHGAPAPLPVSCVVLTGNEEPNIRRCLTSLHQYAGEIIILDSYSTDKTIEIAREFTDQVFFHAYEGHPQQWAWALENLPFRYDWIFAIDADFAVTHELWSLMSEVLCNSNVTAADGYFVRHRQVFRGRPLMHGTLYPRYWLRLFRRARVLVDTTDLVDIHFCVDGRIQVLESDVVEDNVKDRDLGSWIAKQARFARSLAQEELHRRSGTIAAGVRASVFGTPDQRIMWLREAWYRLPLYVRPFLLFVYRYFIRLGFLDGKEGLLYHFTQALLCRMLTDAWLDDMRAKLGERDLGMPEAPVSESLSSADMKSGRN